MNRRRVVITGMGTVTPHSDNVDTLFAQLCEGVSAVQRITQFDPEGLPAQIAAEVRYEVDGPAQVGRYACDSRTMKFVTAAAQRALADAGLEDELAPDDPERYVRAVHLSSGVGSTAMEALGPLTLGVWGSPDSTEKRDLVALRRAIAAHPETAQHVEDWFCDFAAPALAVMFGADRISTAASACASGSHALMDAMHMIQLGRAKRVLTGGVCTPVTRSMMPGFAMLSALSTRNEVPHAASRPFDADRSGFIMGEGSSLMVLEDLEAAQARGARIHGEILGAGIATDAYRLTDPEPTGRGMGEAMRRALKDAGLAPENVDYINAHGTSTKLNDAAESKAVKAAFGEQAYSIPMSSTKSMFGHLIHAAGITEAIVCTKTIQDGRITPTINYETPDPDCDLDYVPNTAREATVKVAMNNSFGFGGQNVSVLIGAYDGGRA
ncbi:MAG: beta-ketoacyl-[acyl-carrier-protein] synthase family protein [Deltaproteobacteria bacterium]|nr:beta-ketoacyl-[acyl-carrier-protein] synthase family protein [Deltaproteobacteria bacterium]